MDTLYIATTGMSTKLTGKRWDLVDYAVESGRIGPGVTGTIVRTDMGDALHIDLSGRQIVIYQRDDGTFQVRPHEGPCVPLHSNGMRMEVTGLGIPGTPLWDTPPPPREDFDVEDLLRRVSESVSHCFDELFKLMDSDDSEDMALVLKASATTVFGVLVDSSTGRVVGVLDGRNGGMASRLHHHHHYHILRTDGVHIVKNIKTKIMAEYTPTSQPENPTSEIQEKPKPMKEDTKSINHDDLKDTLAVMADRLDEMTSRWIPRKGMYVVVDDGTEPYTIEDYDTYERKFYLTPADSARRDRSHRHAHAERGLRDATAIYDQHRVSPFYLD